ncbi:envelope integrity protein Cei [Saccharomonospora sp. NPDC046836]|uniref:envelope integrity protein Cei n=1 Tax=Saccharomonospora sp. NPDC046836 TaxID=3156921 RepID=UPI0033DC4279
MVRAGNAEGTAVVSGNGGVRGSRVRPYRKYKPVPALIVLGAMGLVATFVWVNALSSTDDLTTAIHCEPTATPPAGVTYDVQANDALAGAQPAPPDRVAVRVLNASGARGEAAMTTEGLRQLGFTQIAQPDNDDAYGDRTANCHGQIRFGTNGESAARTLQLVDPCLELVRDNRQDATVDLAVGTRFNDARPTRTALDVLDQLKTWSAQNRNAGNSEQSTGQGPVVDQELLDHTAPTVC